MSAPTTDLYELRDYKLALRARLKELRLKRPGLTFKRVAARVPIQYTYFSRVLNAEHLHFSRDHLFSICQALELGAPETEYLMLMRDHSTASHPALRQALLGRIEAERRNRGLARSSPELRASRADPEMSFLVDPLAAAAFVALHVRRVRDNPRLLASFLGVSLNQVQATLRTLASLDLIELGDNGWEIRKLLRSRLHVGREHPLMRVHQGILRSFTQARLAQVPEEEKHSVQVTFTLDERGFEAARSEFQGFLKKLEGIAGGAQSAGVYHLSFDLFRWI